MKDCIYLQNKSALEFSRNSAHMMESLCQPLFKNYGIDNFGYVRIYQGHKMFRISTDALWSESYFNHQFYNDTSFYEEPFKQVTQNSSSYVLLTGEPKGQHHQALFDHGIWHAYIKYERREDHTGVCFFATNKTNSKVLDFYLNNRALLELFILSFKEKASGIINDPDPLSFIHADINIIKTTQSVQTSLEDIVSQIQPKKFDTGDGGVKFSKREIETLLYLSFGMTSKEIGQTMNVSPRTIESFVMSIKCKTNLSYKSDIVNFFLEHFDFSPRDLLDLIGKCGK